MERLEELLPDGQEEATGGGSEIYEGVVQTDRSVDTEIGEPSSVQPLDQVAIDRAARLVRRSIPLGGKHGLRSVF